MRKQPIILSLIFMFFIFGSVVNAGLINAGFESTDAWVVSTNGDITVTRISSWSSEGNYSYQFYRNTGSTSVAYYSQITQANIDFTSITSIMFDCQDKGIDPLKLEFYINDNLIGTYTNNGHTDGGTSWGSTATVCDIELGLANQYFGLCNFTIRLQEIGSYYPGDSKSYSIDNIRLVPEPATLSLLALGGIGMLRRKS